MYLNHTEPILPEIPLTQEVTHISIVFAIFVMLSLVLILIPPIVWTIKNIRLACTNINIQNTTDIEECCVLKK